MNGPFPHEIVFRREAYSCWNAYSNIDAIHNKYQLVTFIVRRIRIMILQIRTTLVMRHLYITHRWLKYTRVIGIVLILCRIFGGLLFPSPHCIEAIFTISKINTVSASTSPLFFFSAYVICEHSLTKRLSWTQNVGSNSLGNIWNLYFLDHLKYTVINRFF